MSKLLYFGFHPSRTKEAAGIVFHTFSHKHVEVPRAGVVTLLPLVPNTSQINYCCYKHAHL